MGEPKPPPDGLQGPDASQGPPRRHRWPRRLGALALGLALICLAELILQLADYGGPTRLFLRVPEGRGAQTYVTNPLAFRPTFATNPIIRAQNSYPAPRPQRFPVQKAADAYRICVVGGSAAMGFPHRVNGSFPLFLQSILNTVCEGKQFEVVNAGVSAIGSYSVLERMDEVLTYGVDMVVVYCGHNEFYGAYGAGSAIPLSARRPVTLAQLWLRRRRLSMAMGDLLAAVLPEPPPADLKKRLIGIMPRRTDIRYGDKLYRRVRRNFRANLTGIVHAARRRGVPVVLCTLAVNLRDFPPLGSLHARGFSAGARTQWQDHVEAAGRFAQAGELEAAAVRLQAAADMAPGHAETHFRLAGCLDRLGRHEDAAEHYEAARNFDTVRWRAGGDYNEVIREVADAAGDDGVLSAHVAAYLGQQAEDGIPGADLFLEHVHLTLRGNFTIAEAVARTMGDSALAAGLGRWDWAQHRPFESYAAANGIDDLDRIIALSKVARLYEEGLSGGAATATGQAEALRRQVSELQAGLDAAQTAAMAQTELAFAGPPVPYDGLRMLLAKEYGERGEFRKALREVDKIQRYGAWQLDNRHYAGAFFTEGSILLKSRNPESAIKAARRALALDPHRPGPMRLLCGAYRMLGDHQAAERWEKKAAAAERTGR